MEGVECFGFEKGGQSSRIEKTEVTFQMATDDSKAPSINRKREEGFRLPPKQVPNGCMNSFRT